MTVCALPVLKRILLVLVCVLLLIIVLKYNTLEAYVTGNGKLSIASLDKSATQQFENHVWSGIGYKGGRLLSEDNLKDIRRLHVNHCGSQRFLVYKCDSSSLCGGWADRQRGIVSSFLLSVLTNRTFIVDLTSPCELKHFLLPNVYNWSMCSTFLKTIRKENISKFNYVSRKKKEFLKQIKTFDFDRQWTKQVILLRLNSYVINGIRQHKQAKVRLKWLMDVPNVEAIHMVLHTLFKPSKKLLNDAELFYNNRIKWRRLVCSHIRMGKNPSLPEDNTRPMGMPNVTVIFDFLERFDNDQKHVIYIASDSDETKRLAKTRFKSYININRTIVHIDRLGKFKKNSTEACDGFYTALFEHLIISMCHTIVLTRSGFGTTAAYVRGSSENLYVFHPITKRILHTNLTDLHNHFRFFQTVKNYPDKGKVI